MKKLYKILLMIIVLSSVINLFFLECKSVFSMDTIFDFKSESLPDYYTDDWLNKRLDAVKSNTMKENTASFIFITDLHYVYNSGYSAELIRRAASAGNISHVINGGDQVRAYADSEDTEIMKEKLNKDIKNLVDWRESINLPVYMVHGNHDFTIKANRKSSDTKGYTYSKKYTTDKLKSLMPASSIKMGSEEDLYYYFDDQKNNIRYIVLDLYEKNLGENIGFGVKGPFSHEQINWFLNTAINVENYNFVIVSHAPADPGVDDLYYDPQIEIIREIEKAINNYEYFSFNYNGKTYSKDFSQTTNHVLMHLSGHTHKDRHNFSNNVLSIGLTSDAHYVYDTDENNNLITRDKTDEHAFDVITIDFDEKKIKTVRFGVGKNKEWSFKTYTVNYDSNGGTGIMNSSKVIYNSEFMTRKNMFTKKGYTFAGWNESADGKGQSWYLNGAGVGESGKTWKWTYDKNITLYAQWEPNTYTVNYDANGGTGIMQTSEVTYNSEFMTRKNMFTKKGYTFAGWNESADGKGQSWYLNGAGVGESGKTWKWIYDKNITLYAQWEPETYSYIIKNYTHNDDKKYIDKININTTVDEYKKNIDLNVGYSIDVDYKMIENKKMIYTGSKTKIYNNNKLVIEYKNIIRGDVTGTGKITIADVMKTASYLLDNSVITEECYKLAADVTGDDNIKISDVMKLANYLLNGGY